MSHPLSLSSFTLFCLFYAGVSTLLHLGIAFTSQAWIIYFLTLLPFYGAGLVLLVVLVLGRPKNSQRLIRYRKVFLLPILFFQLLVLLTSPASCYGWSQGLDCYSFIQSRIDVIKPTLDEAANPPHWQSLEAVFPLALILYIASIVLFAVLCHGEDRPGPGAEQSPKP